MASTTTTAKSLLSSLASAGGYIGLAVQLGETIIPIGEALVNKIKSIKAGVETETYQLLVAGDQTELTGVVTIAEADLAAINSALVAAGLPPLPVPAAPVAPTPPTSAT